MHMMYATQIGKYQVGHGIRFPVGAQAQLSGLGIPYILCGTGFGVTISLRDMAGSGDPLRILSLDGGGIRGLSQLVILNDIMERLEDKLGRDPLRNPCRPCEFFDLICGTSTGGLSALMLGRLQMVCIASWLLYLTDITDRQRLFTELLGHL